MLLVGSVAAAARRPRENLRRRSNLYIHGRDEEVKNDYRERTHAKDVQSTAGGIRDSGRGIIEVSNRGGSRGGLADLLRKECTETGAGAGAAGVAVPSDIIRITGAVLMEPIRRVAVHIFPRARLANGNRQP